jgi:hypothetical protein
LVLMADPTPGAPRRVARPKRPSPKLVGAPFWVVPAAVVAGIALLIGVFLLVRHLNPPAPPPIDANSAPAVVAEITAITPSELDKVGLGSATNSFKKVSGAGLTAGGKPVVLYIGAEFCPYCAFERWALIIALSRFGKWSGVQETRSSSKDVYPNTPTFTFRAATFTSSYVVFQAVETADRNKAALQSPSTAQKALYARYDAAGTIPFVDFGNRYTVTGATYANVGILDGMSWKAIADALMQPASAQAKAVLGSANLVTAAVCQLTAQKPAAVCSLASIKAIEARLG